METFKSLVVLLIVKEAFPSSEFYSPGKNASDKLLSREKRFLVYVPNGGVMKFVTGYLGPIDIPLWQVSKYFRRHSRN